MFQLLSQLLKYFKFEVHYPYDKTAADAGVVPVVVAEAAGQTVVDGNIIFDDIDH